MLQCGGNGKNGVLCILEPRTPSFHCVTLDKSLIFLHLTLTSKMSRSGLIPTGSSLTQKPSGFHPRVIGRAWKENISTDIQTPEQTQGSRRDLGRARNLRSSEICIQQRQRWTRGIGVKPGADRLFAKRAILGVLAARGGQR